MKPKRRCLFLAIALAALLGAAPGLRASSATQPPPPGAPMAGTKTLQESEVRRLAAVAAWHWIDSGIGETQLDVLNAITYTVAPIGRGKLGVADGLRVTIDDNAAGAQWFVDATPGRHEEYARPSAGEVRLALSGAPSAGSYDLLTVLMHEQGHVLGLRDEATDPSSLMFAWLNRGERRLPAKAQAARAVPGSVTGPAYLTVLNSNPAANTHTAAPASNVTLNFDTNLDAATVNAGTVGVHGGYTGLLPGSFSVAGSQLTFDPAGDFMAGERVQVTVTAGVEDAGANPSDTRVVQFRAGTSAGNGLFYDSGQDLDALAGAQSTYDLELGDLDGDGDLDAFAVEFSSHGNVVWENTGVNTGVFQQAAVLGTQNNQAAVLADFDGDGDLDAFVGSDAFGNRVWFNNGSFNFTDGGEIPLVFVGATRSLATGDLDGDGDMDVFLGNLNQENKVWINDGTGTFSDLAQAAFSGVNDASRGVALGDLDGDGDLDAFVANTFQFNRIWLNDGTGVFAAGQVQNSQNRGSYGVDLGDLDDDGDLDAVVANAPEDNTVWQNDGTGTFADIATLPGIDSNDVKLGDVDGDGDLDVVLAGVGPVGRVWLNDGASNFSDSGQPFDTSPDAPLMAFWSLDVGDLNGDGALDIFFGNQSNVLGDRVWINGGFHGDVEISKTSPAVSVLQGGTLTYTLSVSNSGPTATPGISVTDLFAAGTINRTLTGITPAGGAISGATTGPFSGDFVDSVDLPAGSQIDYHFAVTATAGCASLASDAVLTNRAFITVPLTVIDPDFGNNEDYESDIVLPAPPAVGTGLCGSGIFLDSLQPSLGQGLAVAMGDLDGDGDLDAYLAGSGTGDRTLLNDGNGIFTELTQSLGTGNSRDIKLGDVDGDGDLDAFIVNWLRVNAGVVIAGPNEVWINNGAGLFTNSGQSLGGDGTFAVSLGDVDGDGDLDAFTANNKLLVPFNTFSAANRVWLNDGKGTFTDSGQSLGTEDSYDVQLGDLDGDGDLDAFVVNFSPAGSDANTVWVNNGSGTFTNSGQALGNSNSYGVSLGDLDGDGDLDAFVTNFAQPDRVWRNNGAGTFTELVQTTPLGTDPGSRVKLGDLDDDGDLDAFVTNFGAPDRAWLNDGAGQFTGGAMLGSNSSFGLSLGDVDGDGDLDAFAANSSAQDVLVWLNQQPLQSQITSPLNGAIYVDLNAVLTLHFDELVQAGGGSILIRRLAGGQVVEVIPAVSGQVQFVSVPGGTAVNISLTGPLTGYTGFYVEVERGAFENLAGVPSSAILGQDAWSFTTAPLPLDVRLGAVPGTVELEWISGTLFTSDDLQNPWTEVIGATSPYIFNFMGVPRRYWQLR